MRYYFLQLLFLLTPLAASAGNFNSTDLEQLIHSNKVSYLDRLIPLLPQKILMNPLMIYDSHANSSIVDPLNPRVVLFNEDASLIMAFTKNPGLSEIYAGNDRLEILEFSEATKKFVAKEMIFNGRMPPANAIINRPLCLRCHGTDPRPIFNDYNAWPGFYGSFGTKGYAVRDTKEFNFLKDFLNERQSKARYLSLNLDGYALDSTGYKTTARGMGELSDRVQFSINLMFGAKIEALMWKRLGSKLVNDKNFNKLAPLFYLLGEETNRCGPIREKVKEMAKFLKITPETNALSQTLTQKINQQTLIDQSKIETIILDYNSVGNVLSPTADPRGVINIIYSNLKLLGNSNYDQESFFDLLLIMESVFRKLSYSSTDISTTPGRPTAGIFHLKRLGQRAIDEQFFQNLISGIYESSPSFKQSYDSLGCNELMALSEASIKQLSIPDPLGAGVLYR